MSNLFDAINHLKSELNKLSPMSEADAVKLNKKLRLEFNFNSNHLEGNTLTYGDTELLLIFDDTKGEHTLREYEEMKAHDVAFQLIEEWAKDKERPLTEQAIKNLNQIILVRPFWKDAETPDGHKTRRQIDIGVYKKHPNSVRLSTGGMFNYATPLDTPMMMTELVAWYNENEGKLHPVELAALLHYKFVCIHPFDDGNGRVSRLLMNYVLLRNELPPVVIKSADKTNYLRALNRADSGDEVEFVKYVSKQLVWSLELSIKAAQGESIDEREDWKKHLQVLKVNLASKEEIKTAKSFDVLDNLMKTTLSPFLGDIMDAISNHFGDMFLKINTYFKEKYKTTATSVTTGTWQSIFAQNRNLYYSGFEFLIALKTFSKNGANTFDLGISISVEFGDYMFKIHFGGIILEKLYLRTFSDDEVELLINALGEYIVQGIRNNLDKQ